MGGINSYSYLVVGVPINSIGVTLTKTLDTFEIHDERGRPTGKMKTETVCIIKTPTEEIRHDRFYIDTVETACGIRDSQYNRLNELNLFAVRDYSDCIIGLEYKIPTPDGNDFIQKINMGDLTDLRIKVNEILKKHYGGCDFSELIQLYFVRNVSY